MKSRLLVFTATYNESENIEDLLKQITSLNLNSDILVIDDNSPDGTGKLVADFSKKDASVKLISRKLKLGIGSAHREAIQYAYDNNYETLITLDADFSHQPKDIPRFIAKSNQFDVVLGSRFRSSTSLSEWNPFRKFITHTGHFLTVNLLGMPFDASGALRLYNLNAIPRCLFEKLNCQNYEFFFESLLALYINKISIGEVEVNLPARTYGHSKMKISHIMIGVWRLFLLSMKLRLQKNIY